MRILKLLGCSMLVAALAHASKISTDLLGVDRSQMVDVIVQFQGPADAAIPSINAASARLKQRFSRINGALFQLPAAALPGLANNPAILFVSPDRQVSGSLEFAEAAINANIAFNYGWDGSGITVAVIDSADHPDLDGRIVYQQSFGTDSTSDAYGHGTHVAGIIAGNGSKSSGSNAKYTFRGIAPKARLVSLKVLDGYGKGTDSAVIAAFDRAIDLKNQYNIRIINISLGRQVRESYTLDPLCRAVERAWQAGIVVVVAAGNNGRDDSMGTSGYGTISSPGNDPYVITAGAMKDMGTTLRGDDVIASYSSKGPTLIDR